MKSTSLLHAAVIAAVTLGSPTGVAAQSPGKLVGRVLDASTGQPLGGARISVVGTSLTANSAVDGRYTLATLPAGTITLRVLVIGYGPKTVTAVRIEAAEVTTLDVTLSAQAVQLGEITVTAAVELGSVNSALDEQRHTVGIMNAVTAEQIAASPDGDAAAAVQRVSGATVQDGKYVFVRGLGDRYTTASLNGSRIPSPEPEKKVVPLDLFPAALLSAVTTSKTFTPDQSGDFSGAAVDIRTRDHVGRRFVALSVSSAYNDAVTARSGLFAQSTGRDWIALGASNRALPASLAGADFTQSLPASQVNGLVGELRNVWSPRERSAAPNASGSATTRRKPSVRRQRRELPGVGNVLRSPGGPGRPGPRARHDAGQRRGRGSRPIHGHHRENHGAVGRDRQRLHDDRDAQQDLAQQHVQPDHGQRGPPRDRLLGEPWLAARHPAAPLRRAQRAVDTALAAPRAGWTAHDRLGCLALERWTQGTRPFRDRVRPRSRRRGTGVVRLLQRGSRADLRRSVRAVARSECELAVLSRRTERQSQHQDRRPVPQHRPGRRQQRVFHFTGTAAQLRGPSTLTRGTLRRCILRHGRRLLPDRSPRRRWIVHRARSAGSGVRDGHLAAPAHGRHHRRGTG